MYSVIWLEVFASVTYGARKPYVAKLSLVDGRIERDFLRGNYDYKHAYRSRGVWIYYSLPVGIYEVKEVVSWRHYDRYLLKVIGDGSYTRFDYSKEQAICLLNQD